MKIDGILPSLLRLAEETEWVEFKMNYDSPEAIGEYALALSNSAALAHEEAGYLVWGVDNASRSVVGTDADPKGRKVGNEPLETRLTHLLDPRVDCQFIEGPYQGKRVVILRVQAAIGCPVAYSGTRFIRIGSSKSSSAHTLAANRTYGESSRGVR